MLELREIYYHPQNMHFRILDLFSGAGGISCGLSQVDGFHTVIANDFNRDALRTFKYNHPDAVAILGDITDHTVKNNIIDQAKALNVNMIVGGPPCQGFSNKGKKLGLADERNFLFLEYIDVVKQVKPTVFIIENVKNLVSCANGYFINEIVETFKQLGYQVDYRILNAYDFGIPQQRERAIIIGTLNFTFDFQDLQREEYTKITVRDAISDLAYLNSSEGSEISLYLNDSQSIYQEQLRNKTGQLFNHKATNHAQIALDKLQMIPPECGKEYLPEELHGKQKFHTTWARLEWDKPSPTVDTRFDTPSNGKNSHPYLHRAITPREAARLQSFPDSYHFLGAKTEICKQIGNAVPPLLAKALAKSIKRQVNYFNRKIDGQHYQVFNGNMDYVYNYFVENNMIFDHIITDPPYVISQENNFSTMTSSQRKGIDFGNWDKDFDPTQWISKYAKLLSKNGSMIVFCSYRNISYIVDELEKNGLQVKDFIEWKKTNPMPRNIHRRYVQDTEFAVWAVKKGAKWIFNKPDDVPYLRSTFTTSTVAGLERTEHPTQKSLKLFIDILKIHTNEGDLILDPFMGSGTTGVAAMELNRKFVGIELSEKYFEIAIKRLSSPLTL